MARRRWSAEDRRQSVENHHRRVAETLIEAMREGRAVWTQAWNPGRAPRLPANVSTGKEYRGGNSLHLFTVAAERGYSDHRWGTFKQVKGMGGHVRRGEKGSRILAIRTDFRKLARDGLGRPLLDDKGRRTYETRKLRRPIYRTYTVFNAEQCEGLPERPRDDRPRWADIDEAERVLKGSGAAIRNEEGDRAYYDLARDRIVLPHREQFPDAPTYYQTALHELGHWTGHPERLNRETLVRGTEAGFWSPLYAREELRAEISSMVTCQRLNLGHDPERHAGYVRTWVRALRDDPREIYRAASEAYRISDYIFERVRERDPEREAGGRDGERSAERKVLEPSAPKRGEDPRPAAGEQQRLFQRERVPEGRFAPGR